MTHDSTTNLFAEIEKATFGLSRSQLREWMVENYSALSVRLEHRKTDWKKLAVVFAKAGLVDGKGNPPAPETARKTWQRVRGAMKTREAKLQATATPAPDEPQPEVAIPEDKPEPRKPPKSRFEFKTATLRTPTED